jgi:acetyltransferase
MLEKLFSPKSIAVIGASLSGEKEGRSILANLVNGGYQGEIIPVSTNIETMLDLPVYSSLRDYQGKIDLVIIEMAEEFVLEAARDAVSRGVGAVIVVSSGLDKQGKKETGIGGELSDICRRGGVRLLGPGSLGLINVENNLNGSAVGELPLSGGVSFFSQSGALCATMLDMADKRHLGLSKLVSIGSKLDISEVDLLRFLSEDPETKVIVGYLEDICSGNSFVKAAEEASRVKPVIILKSGITAAGRKAAASHTGGLAGEETAYGAAFKRAGVCRAESFEALFDYAAALSMQPVPAGERVLIITNAGGPGALAADAVEGSGLQVARLGGENKLVSEAGEQAGFFAGNPVVVLGNNDVESFVRTVQSGQQDSLVDSILLILTPGMMIDPAGMVSSIGNVLDGSKPVLASFMGGGEVFSEQKALAAASLPCYSSPERAVAALKASYQYGVWRRRPPRLVTRFPVNRRRVERIIYRRQRTGNLYLSEVKAKDILKAYGFHVQSGQLATTAEDAVEVARFIGFPVAMKIVSANIIHKTDLGGVSLNLSSAREVEDAFDLMHLRIKKHVPDAVIEGVYVEKMAESGLEVILGMTRDPQFGPMLMFGLGGIFVEVMKDITFYLAPITEEEAIQMLRATRSYEMLKGKRGSKEVDIQAVARSLQRISQLTTDFPQIMELDINPLIVGEVGSDPVVVDARMTLVSVSEDR